MKCSINTWRAALVALQALLLAGCASFGDNRPAQEVVRERAQAWADALLDGDLQGAYDLTSPNYRRYSRVGAYNARVEGAARWDAATVRDVVCPEEDLCEVTYLLEYRIKQADIDMRRPRTHKWVKTEGQWWLYVPPR
ncbi:MAG: hypothetical protein CME59_03940 [Halioglobus sp.]|nr:hypothetical protein [Halioglobus sp.]